MNKAITKISKARYLLWCLPVFALLLFPVRLHAQEPGNILLTINKRDITASEFLHSWEKSEFYPDDEMLDIFTELYIELQLKVEHAIEEGIHLEEEFTDDFERYRRQMAVSFLGDPQTEEKLAREAYERMHYEINASHILIRLPPHHSPEDTLLAREKALEIRNRLSEGEIFEHVAKAVSDDPSVKHNSGNLGWFTALQTPYPFENAVYELDQGEISMPVRSRFGYHLIRVNEKVKSRGEVKAAHIMIGFNKYDEEQAAELADEVYNNLLAGYSFELLAREHSTDHNTAAQGGVLHWFGAGKFISEFEDAAFSLQKPGDISKPVLTSYGWHIIRLIDRRALPPYGEQKQMILENIREYGGSRSAIIREALIERLKGEWGFTENRDELEIFYNLVDNRVFEGTWTVPGHLPLDAVILNVGEMTVTQKDFAGFIAENAYIRPPWPIEEYVELLYRDFVSGLLIAIEESALEEKYPVFRYLLNEYRNGILLYEITNRKVWQRVLNDSAKLEEFYQLNDSSYMWQERVCATIFSTGESSVARRISWRARRSSWFGRRDENWIMEPLNRMNEGDSLISINGLFSRGDNPVIDRIEWEEGVSDILRTDNRYNVVLVHYIRDPEPKSIEEAGDLLMTDFQAYLERNWVQKLREKYNIEVHRHVLKTIIPVSKL